MNSEPRLWLRYVPNLLTLLRMALVGLLYALVHGDRKLFVGLYVLAAATDSIDGFLARRLGADSELGSRLDRIADVLFFGSSVIWTAMMDPAVIRLRAGLLTYVLAVLVVRQYLGFRATGGWFGFHLPASLFIGSAGVVCFVVVALGGGSAILYLLAIWATIAAVEGAVWRRHSRAGDKLTN